MSYTVTFDGEEPNRTVAVANTPSGIRCVAFSDDPDLARHAISNELGGAAIQVRSGNFAMR